MEANPIYVVSEELQKKINFAKQAVEKTGKTFVAALYKTLARQENVCVIIPGENAKYLKLIKAHGIAVFKDENLNSVTLLEAPDHYVHGDFPQRNADGTVSPKVIRHFLVEPSLLGKEICANVEIKEKTDLLTGRSTIIVDIQQLSDGRYLSNHILRLGGIAVGLKNEVPIPETNLCVRFEKINEKIISSTGKSVVPVKATPAPTLTPRLKLVKKVAV